MDQFMQQVGGMVTKKPFIDRLKDTVYLLKYSFTIFGRDVDLKKPAIRMAIFTLVNRLLAWGAFLNLLLGHSWKGLSVLTLLFVFFILVPARIFYDIRQRANQSWIAYNVLTGKNINYADARAHTRQERSKLYLIAFVDLLMRYAGRQRSGKKGIAGVLIILFLAALVEVWDLLSNYMIPAVVVEQKPLKEIVPEIKAIRANVPAALVGVFGFDFAGNVIRTLFGQIQLLVLLLSLGIGYYFAPSFPPLVLDLHVFGTSQVISVFPLLIFFCIVSLASGVFKKFIESIKAIYFTIFYTAVMRPTEIIPEMRTNITNYLLMQEPGTVTKE